MNEEDFIEKEKIVKEGKLIKIRVKDLIPELEKIFSNEFLERKGGKISTKPFHDRYSINIETTSESGFLIKVKAEILFKNLPQKDLKGKEYLIGRKNPPNKKFKQKLGKYEKPEDLKPQIALSDDVLKDKKYLSSIGWKIHHILKMIEYYKYFFDQNYLDLLIKIFEYKENLSYLYAIKEDGTRNLDDFNKELSKDLHNYLMSLFSLRDKTIGSRNHINNNFGKKISEDEYSNKLNEFKVDEYSDFLKNLRHDFTHGTEEDGLTKLSFVFDFINSRGDIFIGDKSMAAVIMSYNNSINQFYNWFFTSVTDMFSDEFNDTNRLIREYNGDIAISLNPGKGVKNPKEYKCCECDESFKSSNPMGLLDKNDNVLGYICKNCKSKLRQEQINKRVCTKCQNSLKEVKTHIIKSIKDNDIGLHLFYTCPNCYYEGHLFLKMGKKQFNFIKR